jgi:hypothetical protein
MPLFRISAGTYCHQYQAGEIGTAGNQNNAGNSGFKDAAPDLYYRQFPWVDSDIYKLGLPWPMAAFYNDAIVLPGEADEWRVFQQFGPLNSNADAPILVIVGLTEANDTLAATATLLIRGAFSSTEAGDSLVSTGTLALKGTASIAEAGDTLSATGALALKGVAAVTEVTDTLASTGTLAIKGTLSSTEADDTLVSTGVGSVAITGTLAATEAGDTLSAAGTLAVRGTVGITEAGDTLAATGSTVVTIVSPRRGGWDERQEFERRRREWQESLRPIIDRSFRIANGEIDPVTFEEIPPPDYSNIKAVVAASEMALDQQRNEQFKAEQNHLQEDEAIAILLLAA